MLVLAVMVYMLKCAPMVASPLLANIYLHELDRYMESKYLNLTAYERHKQRMQGKGNALYNLKRYEEPLAAYEQAIRLDPNLALAYNNKGLALNNLKRYQEAEQAFEKAHQLGFVSQ